METVDLHADLIILPVIVELVVLDATLSFRGYMNFFKTTFFSSVWIIFLSNRFEVYVIYIGYASLKLYYPYRLMETMRVLDDEICYRAKDC